MLTKNQKEIKIVRGDLFDHIDQYIYGKNNGSSVIVPHVCNNSNSFGAGFAGALARKYPIVKENYHLLGSHFLKNNIGYTQYITTIEDPEYKHKLIFANMIAQNGTISSKNPRPLNYLSLVKCMVSVSSYIQKNFDSEQTVKIHCPKFGCGLAGGNWNFIKDLIEDIWNNHSVIVYQI
jgi:hypothetical protein